MPSIKSLIDTALRQLGLVGSGEQASETEYADGLAALRRMLDAWSLEPLLIPYLVTETFPLSGSKAFYSMGPGGDWNTARPEKVEIVRILIDGSAYPLQRSTAYVEQFRSRIEIGRPSSFVNTADSLMAYVEFDAFPDAGEALVTSLKPFNVTALDNFDQAYVEGAPPQDIPPAGFTLTGIQTSITFPPGYEAAIVAGLAVELAPEYPGVTLSPVVLSRAAGTKALIKRRNSQPMHYVLDPFLVGGRRVYDIVAGPGL